MILDKMVECNTSELKALAATKAAEMLYDKAVRGEELEQQIKEFLASEYSLIGACFRGVWWLADQRDLHYGITIHNPDTEDGGFPDLAVLLKWCIENRKLVE